MNAFDFDDNQLFSAAEKAFGSDIEEEKQITSNDKLALLEENQSALILHEEKTENHDDLFYVNMVYIASPFWDDDESIRKYRRRKAIEYSDLLFNKGVSFYCPLLYSDRFADKSTNENYWIAHGRQMVNVCNEMHVLCLEGWENSSGIAGEIYIAKKNKLKIKYVHGYKRVSFHGSRSLSLSMVSPVFREIVKNLQVDVVVTHGEAEGACSHIRDICKKDGISLMLHHLDKKRGRGQYHWRSVAVLEDSEYAVFFYDGFSKGTKNEIELAKKIKISYEVYLLKDGNLVLHDKKTRENQQDDFIEIPDADYL